MRFFSGPLVLAPLLGLPLLAATLLAACGGSSSETPPPLQPDPAMRRYTGPRVARAGEPQPESVPAEGGEAAAGEDSAAAPSGAPAPGTWGSGKSLKPAAVPK